MHYASKCTYKLSCSHITVGCVISNKSQDQSDKPNPKNNVNKCGKADDKSSIHKTDALDDEIEAIDEACNTDNTDGSEIETTVSNLGRFYELLVQ